MTRKLYDIAAKTGEYTKNGETKARWQTVGTVLETDRGMMLLLDRTFNPAGMPMSDRGDPSQVMLSLFEPKQQQPQQRRDAPERGVDRDASRRELDSQAPAGGRRRMADELSDDVPFQACWEA